MTPRQLALANGKKHYAGPPCLRGHTGLRFVSSARCVECAKSAGLTDAHRQATRKWYAANRETHRNLKKKWNQENSKQRRAKDAEWRRANPERMRGYYATYRRTHLGVMRAQWARKHIAIAHATPAWADRTEIARIYDQCPKGMHVDHEIPLRGKTVCGLHVPSNLQYLTATDNMKKGNKYA